MNLNECLANLYEDPLHQVHCKLNEDLSSSSASPNSTPSLAMETIPLDGLKMFGANLLQASTLATVQE